MLRLSRILRRAALGLTAAALLLAACSSSTKHAAPPPTTAAIRASAGCAAGVPALQPGLTHQTLEAQGLTRHYRLFVPAAYRPGTAVPLVLDLHGYSEPFDFHAEVTKFEAKGQQVGAVVLTPEGQGKVPFWNVGKGDIDDVAFLNQLLDHVEGQLCIDMRRVDVTGFSNGAFMTTLLACRDADRFAAFAPVAGLLQYPDCKPARPVPIISFHGTADPFLAYNGGFGPGVTKLPINPDGAKAFAGIQVQPVEQSAKWWATFDRCHEPPATNTVTPTVARIAYGGCAGGSAVELYRVDGGGHAWPGSKALAAAASVTGKVDMSIDATDLIWQFFAAHPLPAAS